MLNCSRSDRHEKVRVIEQIVSVRAELYALALGDLESP